MISESTKKQCQAALADLRREADDLQAAMSAIERVLNGAGLSRRAGGGRTPAKRGRAKASKGGDGEKRFSYEKSADKHVRKLEKAGMKVSKTFAEGTWVLRWTPAA